MTEVHSLADQPLQLDEALERIRSLEAALARNQALLSKTQERLYTIYTSNGWKILARCCVVRALLFPKDSKHFRAAAALVRACVRWSRLLLKPPHRRRKLRSINDGYDRWIKQYEPGPEELDRQRHTKLSSQPRISLLVTTAGADPLHLDAMLRSVLNQTYARWELCVAIPGRQSPELDGLLREVAGADNRVRIIE